MSRDEMITTSLLAILSTVNMLAVATIKMEPMLDDDTRKRLESCIELTQQFYMLLKTDIGDEGEDETTA